MDYIKEKSVFNLEAAKMLYDSDLYAPSVHCSYYGCYQFIKHKLDALGHTYEDIDNTLNADRTLSSHIYPRDLLITKINMVTNDGGVFSSGVKDKIKILKNFRILSDYRNELVDSPKSKAAIELSKEIIQLIKTKL